MQNQEDRKTRFKRVATRRTERILENLRILGNCANRSTYDYNDDDIAKIFYAIENQLRLIKAKFKSVRRKKFTL
ncbi:MAG: hypothetical protein CO014_00225 [Candidatus Tagabacteria bacterium CG_4_8_14_3_um_filter_41_8]|uniref:Uncharacterized protein n=1 Tax=Candidatus Tagabacteria bacterium CG_4_8_14_3_um_filter_41_8 TaxID=1975018 RepID=A0A2M8G9K7_9BACT|nr:MAG: hypothetical protein CO014_00225 [Candidatus Tagabacteria bacterium CG_4_8_14_3_um_filter_41_8]